MVEMQGGLISVHSVLGRGSTFCVVLPIHVEPVLPGASDAQRAWGALRSPDRGQFPLPTQRSCLTSQLKAAETALRPPAGTRHRAAR
jgi:hypothetical protein